MRKKCFKSLALTKFARYCTASLSLFFLLSSQPQLFAAKNNSLRKGLVFYTKGEFDHAISELQKALKQKPKRDERTKIYKFTGMSLFTLGRLPEAENNFKQCLNNDSSCAISKGEALDEAVLPFFQDVKRRLLEKEKSPKIKTHIVVHSPIKNADILLDGILLGPANTPLDVKPGTVEITLQAPGYRSKTLKISVNKDVENSYSIPLEKIPPKPEPIPEPKVDAKATRAAALAASQELSKSQKSEARAAKEGKKEREPSALPQENIDSVATRDDFERDMREARSELQNEERDRSRSRELRESREPRDSRERRPRRDDYTSDRGTTFLPYGMEPPKEEVISPFSDSKKSPVNAMHFLPLGVGQFYNHDYLLGSMILGLQVYSGVTAFTSNQSIDEAETNESNAYAQAAADSSISTEDLLQLHQAKTKYVQGKQDEINTSLGIIVGAWAFGIIHAILMRPDNPVLKQEPAASRYFEPRRVSLQVEAKQNLGYELKLNWDF